MQQFLFKRRHTNQEKMGLWINSILVEKKNFIYKMEEVEHDHVFYPALEGLKYFNGKRQENWFNGFGMLPRNAYPRAGK